MKNKILAVLTALAFIALGMYLYSDNDINGMYLYSDNDIKDIEDRYSIDLGGAKTVSYEDTHGGFFGDGERAVVFDVSEWEKREETLSSWNDLPLTENLQLIMYGGEKDGMIYGYDLAKNNDIPVITNGKYFFYDRLHENYSDSDLFSGASFNFTIFMYDNDTQRLYMLEFDT